MSVSRGKAVSRFGLSCAAIMASCVLIWSHEEAGQRNIAVLWAAVSVLNVRSARRHWRDAMEAE